ncbi:hypothetical protein [Nocardioides solisilvae]|uniref:hypothetical protein n=1 Tax=Nocardioides solisilvae TaxID=1542435 RepID=UPI000D740671|nr:hypothetical protein [Nocardioides solisilvae]
MTPAEPVGLEDVDPFELPEWLGTGEVTWSPEQGLRSGHLVAGRLTGAAGEQLPCDLLAVDEAYPAPVVADPPRVRAHQAWQHGQVLLAEREGRLTVAVPGTGFDAGLVLESLVRLALAVGAPPERFAAHLRIGEQQPRRAPSGR